jgi:hypothetical protein
MNDAKISRRNILAASAAVPLIVTGSLRTAAAADLPEVDENSAGAKVYGYVKVSTKDDQDCTNCVLWRGGDAPLGGCPLFPNQNVHAGGWCRSWVKKG